MVRDIRVCFILVLVVSLSHFVQKPFRDEAITILGVDRLAWLMTGAFPLSIFLVLLFYLLRNHLRIWLRWILAVHGIFLLGQFILSPTGKEFLMVYLLFTSVFNLSLISLVSGLVLEVLTSRKFEASVFDIYSIQTIAAIVGPLICLVIPIKNAAWVLLISSLMSGVGALLVSYVPARQVTFSASISWHPVVYKWVVHTFLYTLVSMLFYYLLLVTISELFPIQSRVAAFAFAEFAGNTLGLVIFWLSQNFVSLKKSQLLILPALSVLLLIGVVSSPALSFTLGLLIFFKVIKNGVRSADRDVSLLTLAPATFITTKNILDTLVYRSGDLAGGWLIHWLKGSVEPILYATIFLALLWLVLSSGLTNTKFLPYVYDYFKKRCVEK